MTQFLNLCTFGALSRTLLESALLLRIRTADSHSLHLYLLWPLAPHFEQICWKRHSSLLLEHPESELDAEHACFTGPDVEFLLAPVDIELPNLRCRQFCVPLMFNALPPELLQESSKILYLRYLPDRHVIVDVGIVSVVVIARPMADEVNMGKERPKVLFRQFRLI